MGIKGLCKFLREHNLIHEVPLTLLKDRCIPIDLLPYIYKFKTIHGIDWELHFFYFLLTLKKLNIHPTFIFEGKAPEDKSKTQEQRKLLKDKSLNVLNDLIKDYNSNSLSKLNDIYNQELKKGNIGEFDTIITDYFDRKNTQLLNIKTEDIQFLINIFDLFEIPHLFAKSEAEKDCVSCEIEGVISPDSDCMLYGCKIWIKSIKGGMCEIVMLHNVLKTLKLNFPQFKKLCILSGTDYNNNKKGYGINKIYNYILTNDTKNLKNVSKNINVERVDKLFTKNKKIKLRAWNNDKILSFMKK